MAQVGTVTTAAPRVLKMTSFNVRKHIQITAGGANTLEVATKEVGQSAFTTQDTISGKTIILDMISVEEIQLTASGGDVDFTVITYKDN